MRTAIGPLATQQGHRLGVLADTKLYLAADEERGDARSYDASLDIAADGTWQWKSLREPRAAGPQASDGGPGGRQPNSPR